MNDQIYRTRKTIPCITNKCLKYPACRNKTQIECDDLNRYATYIEEHYHTCHQSNNPKKEMWEHLNTFFPNLELVMHSQCHIPKNIYRLQKQI